MLISDWSSDVCSSDLFILHGLIALWDLNNLPRSSASWSRKLSRKNGKPARRPTALAKPVANRYRNRLSTLWSSPFPGSKNSSRWRSEDRRLGTEGVRKGSIRGFPVHTKKKKKK